MHVWYHRPTIFEWRRFFLYLGIPALIVAFITTGLLAVSSKAAPGINQTMSFQGRLLKSSGGIVPDGHYNMQFKIYQDGDGSTAGDTGGTLKWTETYINDNAQAGVTVSDGFFSVTLGSKTPFGANIDWNQDTLWLSMNVAGSADDCSTFDSGTCVSDGEMLPMKRITSAPYAMNAGKLGGKTADDFVQNSTSQQTGNFNINGTGTANILQGSTSIISPVLDSDASGTLRIGAANASTINIGTTDMNHTINIGTSFTNEQQVTIGSLYDHSGTTIQGGQGGLSLVSSNSLVLQAGGNSSITMPGNGNVDITIGDTSTMRIHDQTGAILFNVDGATKDVNITNDSRLVVDADTYINYDAHIGGSLTVQGQTTYTTPNGASISTAINIPNTKLPDYGNIIALGIQGDSSSSARGILVADARTVQHQATIGVLSVDEQNIMGLSWNGSNTTGYLSNTANSLALQGGGVSLLTATNNAGVANIGIGNNATSGYALDVTGDTNTSTQYRIAGNTVLTGSALTFSGAGTSSIDSSAGQSLTMSGATGIDLMTGSTVNITTSTTNIQIGTGSGSGTPMLLTLDKASSASAIASAPAGSMYYDTSLNAIQCYNGSSWGSCDTLPDTFVSLSPEYAGAVLQGSGDGTIVASMCSSDLNINDGTSGQPTVCGSNETYNYYDWSSTNIADQAYNIFVSYQLPSTFSKFVASSTSLLGKTDSSDSSVSYQIYRKAAGGSLTACGSPTATSNGAQLSWQKATASGTADPSTCGFVAGDTLYIKVSVNASNSAHAYVGPLNFAFSNAN